MHAIENYTVWNIDKNSYAMHTIEIQWRNDGVAAASSDGGGHWWYGASTVLEFLVINFSVCLVLLGNCYIITYCIVWFQVQPLMVVFQ